MAPELHPMCVPLAPLLGEWAGEGTGSYPTIDDFAYRERLGFSHVGKPFLTMTQKTSDADTGLPLHAETGYLRPCDDGTVELVVAQPSGILESLVGTIAAEDGSVELVLESDAVLLSPTAKPVTATTRRISVHDGILVTEMAMAAMGEPLTHHLRAELRTTAD